MAKRKQPKYPTNPFCLNQYWHQHDEETTLTKNSIEKDCRSSNSSESSSSLPLALTWVTFESTLLRETRLIPQAMSVVIVPGGDGGAADVAVNGNISNKRSDSDSDLDVLATISANAQRNKQQQLRQQSIPYAAVSCDDGGDIEMGVLPSAPPQLVTGQPISFSSVIQSQPSLTATAYHPVSVPESLPPVPFLHSLRAKFFGVSLALLGCLLAVMVITVLSLRNNGTLWMKSTGDSLEAQQMDNINTIAAAKAVFVKVMIDCSVFSLF